MSPEQRIAARMQRGLVDRLEHVLRVRDEHGHRLNETGLLLLARVVEHCRRECLEVGAASQMNAMLERRGQEARR